MYFAIIVGGAHGKDPDGQTDPPVHHVVDENIHRSISTGYEHMMIMIVYVLHGTGHIHILIQPCGHNEVSVFLMHFYDFIQFVNDVVVPCMGIIDELNLFHNLPPSNTLVSIIP